MKTWGTLLPCILITSVLGSSSRTDCKCAPDSDCWPSELDWTTLNETLAGAVIRGVPPGAVCYPDQASYDESACATVRSQWFNSTWHAEDPISIDYPIWANNSCNPIFPNGTSITGDVSAGKRGCSIGNYPVYAVKATSAEQIAEALKWAGKKNIRVIVKSTGHSYPGRSVGYGSLSIWTHHLRGVEYLPSFTPTKCPVDEPLTAARAAAGTTGMEAQLAMSKHNSILVTGSNPDVGIVGWMTGGGHGRLSTVYGMGTDNLLEATVVTPSGDILIANPCQNSDLFFAIRGGGGGTYGVVTEVMAKTFRDPQTTKILFQLSTTSTDVTSEYWDLMGFLHAEMQRMKEAEGLSGYYFIVGPPTYPVYAFLGSFSIYNKPNGTMERLWAPIIEKMKTKPGLFQYTSEITHANTYLEAFGATTDEMVATGGSAIASWLLSPKSLKDANVNARVLSEIGASINASQPNGVFSNPNLLGHMIASPETPSYYPSAISMNPAWRNTLTHFVIVEGWPEGIARPAIDSVYRDVSVKAQKLRDLSPETGAYFNEPDSLESDWQHTFFGEHYKRLKEIKQKYDPKNVLWCHHCVGSEVLVEQADGKLCAAGYAEAVDEGDDVRTKRTELR
ncbi:FAD binding domain-containing protein [Bimuria novae-zelandiae CBS 107.79]|uniref:FAD binding domain-containing protein n=1 Tax=Bimuria novae-zelandiae CBS 107.79 TaxID=1447943 RepID=A0A6A5V6D0_9PLEO|nr:FAD binding domain-containing protein [Bimuria novae-zelandiae CBS 107.79]